MTSKVGFLVFKASDGLNVNRWFKKEGLGCRVYGLGFRVRVYWVILNESVEGGQFRKVTMT